ncbi:MAG: PCMD domain-containing protein [Sodaliphilus sp.]|nr:PCMD domain-containing protein [Muribaculaceae bacterium]
MKKIALIIAIMAIAATGMKAEKLEPIKFGDFENWVTRVIKESGVIGGNTKKVYEIAPSTTINGAKAYSNMGGSQWATSNVYAKVMGVVKTSNAVFPDKHGAGRCAKLTTLLEHVKAAGIVNMDVLVSGTIFLGKMLEPVSSTKNPYSKMEMGIPYTKTPKFLQFDYRLVAPAGAPIYSSGFGGKKTLSGRDNAEVFVILQHRWEDSKGNIHAERVGTGRERFGKTTMGWVNKHRIPIWYGDIRKHAGYKPYMGLISKEKSYYARNKKGKMVPVVEEKWAAAGTKPTHVMVMLSSGCGTAYTGTVGMTLWVDNVAFVH